MDWPIALLFLFGILLVFMATGMPIAFAFMLACAIGAFVFWGGFTGIEELAVSIFSSVATFAFLPLPLFILMGTIIFESGVGNMVVDTLGELMGRVPGRLSLIAVAAGTILATLTGASTATVAILSKSLLPQMEEYKYDRGMILGPIVASGQLAPMIPPSSLAIFLAAIGGISIGKLLMAIIFPGLLMAALFAAYIVVMCIFKPSLAPSYTVPSVPFAARLKTVVFHLLPLGVIIFSVVGVIFTGIATPSEAGGSGIVACYLIAFIYRKLNWRVIKNSAITAMETTVMILMIIVAAGTFSKLLSFSGAVTGLVDLAATLHVAPIMIVIASQVLVLFLGTFMGPPAIMMVTMPIYVPIVQALGYDPVWFGVMMLIAVETALLTPPVGMNVFVMKSLAPQGVTTWQVFRAVMPYIGLSVLSIGVVMFVPQIALWLPSKMG